MRRIHFRGKNTAICSSAPLKEKPRIERIPGGSDGLWTVMSNEVTCLDCLKRIKRQIHA